VNHDWNLKDWEVASTGEIEIDAEYDSCCSWGTTNVTIGTTTARAIYEQLKAVFEKECSE
jgi:hypothetical protein